MIPITKTDIDDYGGLLAALSYKSADYIKTCISASKPYVENEKLLVRNIVHTNPHLDEYFAELMFRSSLSKNKTNIDFIEQSIFSKENDLGCKQLWPQASVFGIGRDVSQDVAPLFLFDEHVVSGKIASSCSELVIKYLEYNNKITIPDSLQMILNEINIIDEFGNAHPQHLGNIIKTIHKVKFLFSKGQSKKDDVRDFLSYTWKRALINACIVAVIYCLENNIDLISDPASKKDYLQKSLNEYVDKSLHRSHPNFEDARQLIASNYGNQQRVFNEAVLKARNKLITDNIGNSIPQLLILSRICFACYNCWGENITHMIMTHFWETEFQNQINFRTLYKEMDKLFVNNKSVDQMIQLGIIRRNILFVDIKKEFFDRSTQQKRYIGVKSQLWVINIRPNVDVFNPHRVALNYINKNNNGLGIVLIEDTYIGSKTLFKGQSFPVENWNNLISILKSIEPACWYDPSPDPNQPAPFIINGGEARQYVLLSGMDIDALCMLIQRAF
jgi:hypothetical protein